MLNAFKQSVKALRSNLVRTGLTTLGIVIGIGTVILVLSAGEGFRSLINAQLDAFGTNTLYIQTRVPPTTKNKGAGAASADQSRAASPVVITSLKERDIEDIKKLNNISGAYGMVVGQKVISYRNVEKSILFYGASASRFDIDKGKLTEGRFFTQGEDTGADQVVILGNSLATDLFGQQDPINQLVRLGDMNFTVIGVYESRGGLGGDQDNTLYMPLRTAQKKVLGIDHLLMAIVQVNDINIAEATAEDIRMVLRQNHNTDETNPDKDDFVVQTQADALGTFNTIFNGITILLIAIAAISLIVGGVGIMNIMYVVVTERTSEIGLKKALGAKPSDILNEFLIEAVLVTVIGGVFGIIFGSFLGWVVSLVANAANLAWTFAVPLYSIFIAVGVSATIGILFGVLPAREAAKLDPIRALQYE